MLFDCCEEEKRASQTSKNECIAADICLTLYTYISMLSVIHPKLLKPIIAHFIIIFSLK